MAILAGASITIVTGLKMSKSINADNWIIFAENYILIVSAFLTVLVTVGSLFSFKNKGKSYDIFLFDLKLLLNSMDFDKERDIYEKNKESHYKSYDTILHHKNQ